MNILITGGAGYIGSNLVKQILTNTTYNIIVIDNLSTGTQYNIYKLKKSSIHILHPTINVLPIILFTKLVGHQLLVSIVDYTHTMKVKSNLQIIIDYISFIVADKIDWLYSYYNQYWKSNFIKNKSNITNCSFTDYSKFIPNKNKDNIILFSARFIDLKQPFLLLNSANIIKDFIRKNKYKIVLLGDGILKKQIIEFINKNELNDIIEIRNTIEPSMYFNKSKIFISIQKYENYPSQSLLEAISSECFIIATEVGDTKYLIQKNEGILINSNIEELSYAIKKAIECYDVFKNELKSLKIKTMSKHNIANSAKYYKVFYE